MGDEGDSVVVVVVVVVVAVEEETRNSPASSNSSQPPPLSLAPPRALEPPSRRSADTIASNRLFISEPGEVERDSAMCSRGGREQFFFSFFFVRV